MLTAEITKPTRKQLMEEIQQLKKEKNAIILAHYYQRSEIQDVADYIGDSLGLSQQAAATDADTIVFAGVHFMAETAKILNPDKKVVVPDLRADCSLANSCPPAAFLEFIEDNPDHVVVTYINCSAEIKAMSDIICTSSNAEAIINSIPIGQPIIFAPDRNLGEYLMKKTCREDMLLWDGVCVVHEAFCIDKLLALHQEHPNAKILAHPESEHQVLDVAQFIGSTAALLKYVKEDDADEYLIATEAGILHQMAKEVPHKKLIPVPIVEDNTCACSECAFMKLNTLEKLHHCLKYGEPEVTVPDEIAARALAPIQQMLKISKGKLYAN